MLATELDHHMTSGRQFGASFGTLFPSYPASGNFQLNARRLRLFQRRAHWHPAEIRNQGTTAVSKTRVPLCGAETEVSPGGPLLFAMEEIFAAIWIADCGGFAPAVGLAVSSGTDRISLDMVFVTVAVAVTA